MATSSREMKIVFLICALALPPNGKAEFHFLKNLIETTYPQYIAVFINQNEKLLNQGARKTPLSVGKKNLRVWMILRSV